MSKTFFLLLFFVYSQKELHEKMAWIGSFFNGSNNVSGGNEFVGQYVDIGQQKLRIKKVLAEGILYIIYKITF